MVLRRPPARMQHAAARSLRNNPLRKNIRSIYAAGADPVEFENNVRKTHEHVLTRKLSKQVNT